MKMAHRLDLLPSSTCPPAHSGELDKWDSLSVGALLIRPPVLLLLVCSPLFPNELCLCPVLHVSLSALFRFTETIYRSIRGGEAVNYVRILLFVLPSSVPLPPTESHLQILQTLGQLRIYIIHCPNQ